jgi:hypothetical protein
MRTVSRLRLLCFSFYDYLCRAVHSVTLCPVETMQAHQKYNHVSYVSICYGHIDYTFGGPGGIRTPVQNTFLFASYSNKLFALSSVLFKTCFSSFIHCTCLWSATTLTRTLTNSVTFCIST